MNLLEHYVTNITKVEKIECDWGYYYKIIADVDCYGMEKQKEFGLSQSDYNMVLEKGYYMG